MTSRRALLIGSATGGLTGVANDIEAMAGWLDGLGFALDIRQATDATRNGVIEGLERLTRDSREGDVALLYYSGHGGYAQIRRRERMAGERALPRAIQYLVPTDHDKHTAFRGIFRSELSLATQRLAEKTSNITVILDCCHSTDAVRGAGEAVVKGVIEPWGEGIESHVKWLQAQGHDLDRLPEVRNPSVVLLAACEAVRRAFEVTRDTDGVRCGLFTDCLLHVATALPDPSQVTWDDLMRRVVDRVLRYKAQQRPQVSGPSSRHVFSERRLQRTGALALQQAAGRWFLSAGEAAGLAVGDRFRVVDPLAGPMPARLADVEVVEVDGASARLAVASEDARAIAPGMLALPHPGGATHQRCRIEGPGRLADELRQRVSEIAGLELVAQGHPGPLAFVIAVEGDQATVYDDSGRRLRWPWKDIVALDPVPRRERLAAFVEDLRSLVRGAELLRVARDREALVVPRRLSHVLTFGVVESDGTTRPLPHHGAELETGTRVFLRIQNTSSWPVRVTVFDVGVGRAVTLLNPNEPEGIDLGTGEYELLGAPELRAITGLKMQWPGDTPPDALGEESLVIFISSGTLPLTSWTTADWGDRAKRRSLHRGSDSAIDPFYVARRVSLRLQPPKGATRG